MITWGDQFRPLIESAVGLELATDSQFLADVAENGQVRSVVAFSHWTGHDMDVSVAGHRATRDMLESFHQYVFVQHRCCRVTARIRASNQKSQRIAERLGFKREGVLRRGYGDEDALIYGLLRDDFHYGKQRRQATSGPGSESDPGPPEPVQPVQHARPVRLPAVEHGA